MRHGRGRGHSNPNPSPNPNPNSNPNALEALHGRVLFSFVSACGASLDDGGEQASKARQACVQAQRAAEGQRHATQVRVS